MSAPVEFIRALYGSTAFLFRRTSCLSTVFCPPSQDILGAPWIRAATLTYLGQATPIFNLDLALQKTFGLKPDGLFPLALLIDLKGFSAESRQKVANFCRQAGVLDDSEFLACSLACEIEQLNLGALPALGFPQAISAELARKGLTGCRFPAHGNIDYFIDIESFILSSTTKGA